MNDWGNWVFLSIPLYFAATRHLEGRAKGRAFWAYCWLIAAFSGYNAWHFYATWQALTVPGYALRLGLAAQCVRTLGVCIVETAVLLALPVVWHCHDLRKERRRAGGSVEREAEAAVWPPPPDRSGGS